MSSFEGQGGTFWRARHLCEEGKIVFENVADSSDKYSYLLSGGTPAERVGWFANAVRKVMGAGVDDLRDFEGPYSATGRGAPGGDRVRTKRVSFPLRAAPLGPPLRDGASFVCGGGRQGRRAGADHAPPVDARGGGVAAVAAGHMSRFPTWRGKFCPDAGRGC